MTCRVPWCREDTPSGHMAMVGTYSNGVAVALMQPEHAGVLGEPYVNLFYPSTSAGRVVVADLPPTRAADLADFLLAVDVDELDDIAASLHQAHTTLGGTR